MVVIRASTATALLAAVVAVSALASLVAGQPNAAAITDDEDSTVADEQLTARPPMPAYSTATGRSKPVSNIQKVYRTAKTMAADDEDVVPASMASGNDTTAVRGMMSDLEWLLNVYNPHRWNPVKLPSASKLSVQCRDVMRTYLEALRQGSFWAAKSE